jgi:NodT family efflux transporter outer membrane factor (OMF) lipoprotein
MKRFFPVLTIALLSGCVTDSQSYQPMLTGAKEWTAPAASAMQQTSPEALKGWWKNFNDPILNQLIEMALEGSPDRKIAEARVREARGLKKTAMSALFPEIGASADKGRRDSGSTEGNYYDAGFDASYELDIFGVNRNASSAAEENVLALEAGYDNATLTLIGDIARTYVQIRSYQKQAAIAQDNLSIQQETLNLVKKLYEVGESPRLDVERSENLVNTTRASIPEYERLAENAKLALGVLVGKMPSDIKPVLAPPAGIPGSDVSPVLMSPAAVIAQRPDVRAAVHELARRTDLSESAAASIFPTFTLEGMYGITKTAVLSSTSVWNVAAGAAVSLLNFGRIQGQIDAADAQEAQAYEAYRKTVLQAVADVESALNDYAKINQRRTDLRKAYDNAQQALSLSESLFKEGEISFIDVLDSQRSANESQAAMVGAEEQQAEALVRLYKSLGVGN